MLLSDFNIENFSYKKLKEVTVLILVIIIKDITYQI